MLLVFLLSLTYTITIDNIQLGDIIAQDLDCGNLCDAIEQVTSKNDRAYLSHVAIVSQKTKHNIYVIEAYPPKVHKINLKTLLARTRKNFVLRLRSKYQHTILDALNKAKSLLLKPYDNYFLLNNDRYYCSELVYEIFKKYKIFKLHRMTFKDKSGHFLAVWINYFKKLRRPIPEGKLGISPADIYRSNSVDRLGRIR